MFCCLIVQFYWAVDHVCFVLSDVQKDGNNICERPWRRRNKNKPTDRQVLSSGTAEKI